LFEAGSRGWVEALPEALTVFQASTSANAEHVPGFDLSI